MPSYGIIPWGIGFWGIPHPSAPPSGAFVNIINVQPTAGSFNIARNQIFTFTVKTRFSLNSNTIYVMLDNKLVINGTTFDTINFSITVNTNIDGISKDFTIVPNYLFKDGEVLTLQISATDIYGNPSPPFWGGYIVVDTRPSLLTPIYPLDGYIDVPLDLTLHFLVNQLAAPDSGLDNSTLNVYVDGSPAVLNGVIQSAFTGEYSALNIPSNITDPFEVLLDFNGRYSPSEIVTVSVDVREIGLVPITGIDGYIFDPNGVLVGQGVIVSSKTKLANAEYSLVLAAALSTYLFSGVTVYDGYQFQDTNGNIFKIAQVGIQELIVTTTANRRNSSYTFITSKFDNVLTQPVFAGYFQGVYLVDSLGDGYHINVTWHPARTTRPDYDLAYLVYYSTVRSDVFFEEPKLITQGRKLPPPENVQGADAQLFGFFAQIPLPVGISYYFGVRATEFPHTTLPLIPVDGYAPLAGGLKTVDQYSFAIPSIQTVTSNISGNNSLIVPVTTTTGYANAGGYIIVGSEVMRYTGLTNTTFIVATPGRGLFGTTIAPSHAAGEIVKMYYGNHDDNTVIAKGIVAWESPNDPHRTRPDLITTDFTLEDGYNTGFEPFDYCGYHRWRPDELLSDTDNCGTYVGGQFGGERGLLLYERMLADEEQLLEVTGEPVILLKRIWGGERCICMTSRKDTAKVRSCALCFGTGYKGGYIQYHNPRRNDQKIMVHFAPSDEDIGMGPQSGWDQKFKPGTWTLSVPSIKDRDIIVRYGPYGEMDWIYVVNTVSRGKSVFGQYARQKLSISRLDKTDVLYQFHLMK